MDLSGAQLAELTSGSWHDGTGPFGCCAGELGPTVSPADGSIAFSTDRGGFDARLFVMQADGSGLHPITKPAIGAGDPSWSPDGDWISVTGDPFSERRSCCIPMAADVHSVEPGALFAAFSPSGLRLVGLQESSGKLVTFSIDGGPTTVIPGNRRGTLLGLVVRAMRRTSIAVVALLTVALALLSAGSSAANPGRTAVPLSDDTRIAFTHCPARCQIFTANTDGSSLQRVTHNGGGGAYEPDWSPDGAHIAYASDETGRSEIWIVDADGSNARRLTHVGHRHTAFWPSFSADGQWVLYTDCATAECDGGIYEVRIDGTVGGRSRPNAGTSLNDGSMSSDGGGLAYQRWHLGGVTSAMLTYFERRRHRPAPRHAAAAPCLRSRLAPRRRADRVRERPLRRPPIRLHLHDRTRRHRSLPRDEATVPVDRHRAELLARR